MKLHFMADVKNSKFSQNVQKLLSSPFFIIAISVLTLVLSLFKLTVVSFVVLGLVIALVFVTQRDIKPIIPLILNCILSLTESLTVSTGDKVALAICVGLILLSIIFYIVCAFAVDKKKFVLGKLFWGLVAVTVVGAGLAGLICADYEHIYSLRFLGVMCVIISLYILIINGTDESVKDYTAFAFMCFGLVACGQVVAYYVGCDDVLSAFGMKSLRIGWGMTNTIAPALSLCIPATIYLGTKKYPQVYLTLALVMYVTVMFTFSRAGMLCSTIILPIALIYGFLVTKNKLQYGVTVAVLLSAGVLSVCLLKGNIDKWFSYTKSLGFDDNGRFEVWKYGIEDFKRNKIFGAGFYGEDGIALPGPLKKYHNTILQMLACSGVVGTVAFVFHYFQRYKLMLTKLSVYKTFWLFSLAIYEGCAMLDVGMVMFFIQIMLVLIFASCEKETEKTCVPAFSAITKRRNKMANDDQNFNEEKSVKNEEITSSLAESTQASIKKETSVETKALVQQIENINNGNESNKKDKKAKVSTLTEAKTDKELTKKHKFYRCFFKRFLDILLSAIAMIILSPVYLVTSIMVRIKLGKPVIFKQLRVGKNGKLFNFIKFRSMKNTVDENGELLPDYMRSTKFGNLLRKTSIDELPQLWLVFIGKMSLIGPRPRDIRECVFLNDTQAQRHLVSPGISGWAQVHGRNNINFNQICEFDRYYVENCSLWLDIKIIFLTIRTVFKREGVNGEEVKANNVSEYHGDYLLRTNQITQECYDDNLKKAKELIEGSNR